MKAFIAELFARLGTTIHELADSKKAMATLGAVLALVLPRLAARYGVMLTPAEAAELGDKVAMAAGAYVLGQAYVDRGKAAPVAGDVATASTEPVAALVAFAEKKAIEKVTGGPPPTNPQGGAS